MGGVLSSPDGSGVCLEVVGSNLVKSSLHSTTENIKIKSCDKLTFFVITQYCNLASSTTIGTELRQLAALLQWNQLNYLARSNTDANANELI